MKIQTLIVAGAAAFALLAPAAGAAGNKSARHVGPANHLTGHRVIKHKTGATGKTSKPVKKVTTVAKVKPVKPTPPRTVPYIYVPVPSYPTPPVIDPNECQDSGTNCTDEQACEYWGENCDSLPSFAQPDPATTSDTTTSTDPTAG